MDKASSNHGDTPMIATGYGHLEMCHNLLEQDADRDKANNTPLHYRATVNGHLEIAMLLMSYGADLNARDNDGQLPIDMVVISYHRGDPASHPRRA